MIEMKKPTLKVGDTEYPLATDVNGLVALEDEFDLGIHALVNRFADARTLRVGDIRRLLRVVLRSDGQPMEEGEVNRAIDAAGLPAAALAVAAYLAYSLKDFAQ